MTDNKNPEHLGDTEVDSASGGWKLTNVIISSYQTGGSAGSDASVDPGRSIDYGVVARKDTKRG